MHPIPAPSSRHPAPDSNSRQSLLLGAALTLAYTLAGCTGLALSATEGATTLIWPASGIALAAVLLFGRRCWPGIWLGGLLINLFWNPNPWLAPLLATGNTLSALLALRLLGGDPAGNPPRDPFADTRSTLAFLFLGVLLAPTVAATVGATANALGSDDGSLGGFSRAWLIWWMGDLVGNLLVAPPLVMLAQRWLWRREPDRIARWGRTGRIKEWALLLALALPASFLVYNPVPEPLAPRLGFVPFLFVLWSALRLSPLATLSVSLAVSAGAISGVLQVPATPNRVLIDIAWLYVFLFIQTAAALLIVAVVRERRNALLDAEQARELAQEASRQKSRFLANMSHEIRTPLNGIIGLTSLLQDDVAEAETRQKLRIIQSSADSLLQVLNDILDHARIEAGKLDISPRQFSPAQLAQDVAGLFRGQAELKGIRLQVRLGGDLPASAWADDNRLRQVLSNLLSNAVKFTDQGEVLIQAMRDYARPGHLLFAISDSGIGIAADALEHIFEPFGQADSSSTRRHGGAGLGLTISKQLVERMGGTLDIQSAVGSGTQVTVSVPAPGQAG